MTAAAAAIGHPDEQRKAILAGVIGNVLEWYDFSVYAYFVPVISQLFFPAKTPIVSLLLTFAVFGVGFVMRPVGSVIFGIYGDKAGRRNALAFVILLMAGATFVLGLLPTYEQIGVAAPILLVLVRLAQGLSAGGEWGGSTAYIVEFAPQGRRGFVGSWQQVSVGAGLLCGSAMGWLLNAVMSHDALLAWGWRIPFLLGILLGGIGAYMRWRLSDTPKFIEVAERGEVAKSPLVEAFTVYPRETWDGFGITLHNTVAYYVVLSYMPTYLQRVVGMTQSSALAISTIGLLVFICLIPLMGMLSDRIGRKPMLMASALGYAILTYPLFVMASSGEFWLALLAQLILVFMLSFYAGTCPATYAEIFPTRVRYTALSVGYNSAVAIFGGFAPFIATWLIDATGYKLSPTFYVIAAAIATLLVLRPMKETAFTPLG